MIISITYCIYTLSCCIQVQSNDPNALYRLVQKERALNFPFKITVDGEIQLTEELDREDKDMVKDTLLITENIHMCKVAFDQLGFLFQVHLGSLCRGPIWQPAGSTHGDPSRRGRCE